MLPPIPKKIEKNQPHHFTQSKLVGSDRCQLCHEVRDHRDHEHVRIEADMTSALAVNLALTYEQIEQIKGVALIMLCEKVAENQPNYTANQILRTWLHLAIKELKTEGILT
jgi:hypothetical protein